MATFSDQSIGPSDFICAEDFFFLFGQVGPKIYPYSRGCAIISESTVKVKLSQLNLTAYGKMVCSDFEWIF